MKPAADLLVEARRRGVILYRAGAELRYRAPRGALDPELRGALRARKADLLVLLEPAEPAADRIDTFLGDASIPLAVFHSRVLDRDFVLARDPDALAALTEADRRLPVLFFADCDRGRTLGVEGLRLLLELRERFGPEVALSEVREPGGEA